MLRALKTLTLAWFFGTTHALASPPEVLQVKVFGTPSHLITELRAGAQLQEFQRHWFQKTEHKQTPDQSPYLPFTHKLHVTTPTGTSVWLYNPKGHVTVLSKQLTPVYSVQDPQAFNALLGIQAADPAMASFFVEKELIDLPYAACAERAAVIRGQHPRVTAGMSPTEVKAILGEPDEVRPLYSPSVSNAKHIGHTYWYLVRRAARNGSASANDALVRVGFDLEGRVTRTDHWGLDRAAH